MTRHQELLALRCYRHQRPSTRLHVALRSATCPIAAIDDLVPRDARILDLGCGHGLVALALALSSSRRQVVGVDRDGGKVAIAEAVAAASPAAERLEFHEVRPGWVPEPDSFDAVLVVDVLYLMDPADRDAVLRAAIAATAEGVVVIKEMADGPRWKRRVAWAQEQLSVRVARITRGDAVRLHSEAEITAPLIATGAQVRRVDLARRRLHPHVAFIARRTQRPVRSVPERSVPRWDR